jgi:hypothetical protein
MLCQQSQERCGPGRLQMASAEQTGRQIPTILHTTVDETGELTPDWGQPQTALEQPLTAEKIPSTEAFGKYGKGFWFAKGQISVQFPLATKFPRGHTLRSAVRHSPIWDVSAAC